MGPMDMFFKMGEKVTRGDVNRQADFIYYMVWIIFIAFTIMFVTNGYRLIVHRDINYAVWTLVGFAVCGIQYFSLKGLYEMKKMKKQAAGKPVVDTSLESVDDMMATFNNKDVKGRLK